MESGRPGRRPPRTSGPPRRLPTAARNPRPLKPPKLQKLQKHERSPLHSPHCHILSVNWKSVPGIYEVPAIREKISGQYLQEHLY